jgi:hypothetical protein
MKMQLKCNGGIELVFKYGAGEWEAIETKLIQLGLEKSSSNNLFGENQAGEFYRAGNSELARAFENHQNTIGNYDMGTFDHINRGVILDGRLNVAVFRCVPTNNMVSIKLQKYLTIAEVNSLSKAVANVFSWLINTVATAEIDIKINI